MCQPNHADYSIFYDDKAKNEDSDKLTISVRIAECVVFVLLFDFHLHCHELALEGKLVFLFGSILES